MKLIILLFILTSFGSQAREFMLLQNLHSNFNTLYQNLGHDNNYIEKIYFDHDNVNKVITKLKKKKYEVSKLNKNQYYKYVKECVFMRKGAYGLHLFEADDQNFLVKRFLRVLDNDFIVSPDLYLVKNIELEMISNSCAIMMVGPLNHEIIILQSVSID